MEGQKLDLSTLQALQINDLRGMCKDRGIPLKKTSKKTELLSALLEYQDEGKDREDPTPQSTLQQGGVVITAQGEVEEWGPEEEQVVDQFLQDHPPTPAPRVSDLAHSRPSLGGGIGISQEQALELSLMERRLALEERRLAFDMEMARRGLGPQDGGSKSNRSPEDHYGPKAPKGIVPKYSVEDDITKWFAGFERACVMKRVGRSHWGSLLWELLPVKGRDRLLTLEEEVAESYTHMRASLIECFGLTTEEYRQRFRDTQKRSDQTWVDFVSSATKALEGWIQGNNVDTYEGLYNLIVKEHILGNCTSALLKQHLVDSDLSTPKELGKKADKWVRSRVFKSQGGGSKQEGLGPQKPKEGGGKPTSETPSQSQDLSRDKSEPHPNSRSQSKGDEAFKKILDNRLCFDCQQSGHQRGDPSCSKTRKVGTGFVSVALGGYSSSEEEEYSPSDEGRDSTSEEEEEEEALVALCWKVGPDGKVVIPNGSGKHFHPVRVNGIPTLGLRDTCATHTMVVDSLVAPDQYIEGKTIKVRGYDGSARSKPVARIPLERNGTLSWHRVVVSADLPLSCLLGNDLPEVGQNPRGVSAQGTPHPKVPREPTPEVQRKVVPKKKGRRRRKHLVTKEPVSQGVSDPVRADSKVGTGKACLRPQEVLRVQATVQKKGAVPILTEGRVEEGCLPQVVTAPHSDQQKRFPESTDTLKVAQPLGSGELRMWFWILTAVSSLCWVLAFMAALALAWEVDPMSKSKVGPLTLLVMVGLLKSWVTSVGKLGVALAKTGIGEVGTSLSKEIGETKERTAPAKVFFKLGPFSVETGQVPWRNDLTRRM